jgi:hypothetical protein
MIPAAPLRLSHVLVRVSDLAAAVEDYRALGFTCVLGSAPKTATNAFVHFPTGPFLELFAAPSLPDAADQGVAALYGPEAAARFRRWAEASEGLCDLCVETDAFDIDPAVARLRRDGFALGDARDFRRRRPDGVDLSWRLAAPGRIDLPFLMGAYAPKVPPGLGETAHANGARAVTAVVLTHPEPKAFRAELDRYLGQDAAAAGLRVEPGAAVGVDRIHLRVSRPVALDPARLHGARIAAAPAEAEA